MLHSDKRDRMEWEREKERDLVNSACVTISSLNRVSVVLPNLSSPIYTAASLPLSNRRCLFFQTVSPHAEEAEVDTPSFAVIKWQGISFGWTFWAQLNKLQIKCWTSQSACDDEVSFSCTLHFQVTRPFSNAVLQTWPCMHAAVLMQSRCGTQPILHSGIPGFWLLHNKLATSWCLPRLLTMRAWGPSPQAAAF